MGAEVAPKRMLYTTLKFLHVLLVIIAVGFNVSFGLILGRAAKASTDGRELKYALGTVRLMSAIANGSYVLVLLTGVAMVQVAHYPWALKWIHGSAALLLIGLLIAFFYLTPLGKKRERLLVERGPADPEFVRLSKRSAMVGGLLSLVTLIILWLMVAKPA
jgi:uncharacterized membrane protein